MATRMGLTGIGSTLMSTIPAHSKYAMGGIVPRVELDLPFLRRQLQDMEARLQEITSAKDRSLATRDQIREAVEAVEGGSLNQEQSAELQSVAKKVARYDAFINEAGESMKALQQKIDNAEDSLSDFLLFKETLPVDYRITKVSYRHLSNNSESLHHIILKNSGNPKEDLRSFSEHLSEMHALEAVTALVRRTSSAIMKMVSREHEVCVIGSRITLSQVKVLDKIKLQRGSVLSDSILDNADRYVVITEAVLGAIFIGFGAVTSVTGKDLRGIRDIASSINVFSFESQGAIPQTTDFNLWSTYNAWKASLIRDTHGGFPMAFKTRNLTTIFEENGGIEKFRSKKE